MVKVITTGSESYLTVEGIKMILLVIIIMLWVLFPKCWMILSRQILLLLSRVFHDQWKCRMMQHTILLVFTIYNVLPKASCIVVFTHATDHCTNLKNHCLFGCPLEALNLLSKILTTRFDLVGLQAMILLWSFSKLFNSVCFCPHVASCFLLKYGKC